MAVTVKIPHSTFYPPFRKHFHIFGFHTPQFTFRILQFSVLPKTSDVVVIGSNSTQLKFI